MKCSHAAGTTSLFKADVYLRWTWWFEIMYPDLNNDDSDRDCRLNYANKTWAFFFSF